MLEEVYNDVTNILSKIRIELIIKDRDQKANK